MMSLLREKEGATQFEFIVFPKVQPVSHSLCCDSKNRTEHALEERSVLRSLSEEKAAGAVNPSLCLSGKEASFSFSIASITCTRVHTCISDKHLRSLMDVDRVLNDGMCEYE